MLNISYSISSYIQTDKNIYFFYLPVYIFIAAVNMNEDHINKLIKYQFVPFGYSDLNH